MNVCIMETMEEVYWVSTSKVLVDVEGGNNMMYLPLDKLTGQVSGAPGVSGLFQAAVSQQEFDVDIR